MSEAIALGRVPEVSKHEVSLQQAAQVWLRVALLSFGGPAGQIAVMHRILVEEKALDFRRKIPARAQLLHAFARPGGAAACDLHRLADAPHASAASWPAGFSSFPASLPSWR